ncbi:hypothetical protein [Leptospira neocaledonica]|uniref:Lipoprotein n=1 Tax=Leptospira neocaledonica TaxID=2023192 RepID=A0A2M9ZTB5_9LEPT|nr:hypothetical protein [Leptospira neocaledonica]PJZ75255.1 hypothetical protein CH365_19845 [Leptospira neocaledonica]
MMKIFKLFKLLLLFPIFVSIFCSDARKGNEIIKHFTEGQSERKGNMEFKVLEKKSYLFNKFILSGSSVEILKRLTKENIFSGSAENRIFCGEFNPNDMTIRVKLVSRSFSAISDQTFVLKEVEPNIYNLYYKDEPILHGIFRETNYFKTRFRHFATFPLNESIVLAKLVSRLSIETNELSDLDSVVIRKKKIETIQDCIMNYRIQWCGEQPDPKDREWENCDPPGNEYP